MAKTNSLVSFINQIIGISFAATLMSYPMPNMAQKLVNLNNRSS